jgi:hypothetical protein
MPSNERSAEFYRGALSVLEGRPCTAEYYRALLAAAEAREGGELCTCAGCMPSNWPDTNGWRCKKAHEATQPTAAEVIEAFENIITRTYKTNKDMAIDKGFLHVASTLGEDYRNALALIARWKEANGG